MAVMLGAFVPTRAAASSAESWLAWSSSSDVCGDAAAFAARVERALGRSPAAAAGAVHVNVTAHIATAPVAGAPRWIGEVRLRGDDQRELGARTLDRRDASCQPLVEAMAVVTALALADDGIVSSPAEPPASGDRSAPFAPPAPAAASPPEVIDSPARAAGVPARATTEPAHPSAPTEPVASLSQSPPSAPSSRRWRSGVAARAKEGEGLLPSVAIGVEVSAYLRTARDWKISLNIGGWQRQSSLDAAGRGASFQRVEVGLSLCPLTIGRGPWAGAACAGADLGRLSISGVGFARASTQDRLVLDAGVGAAMSRRLVGPLTAGLSLGLTAPLIRDRISYGTNDGGVVSIYRESVVAVIGSFRLAVAF